MPDLPRQIRLAAGDYFMHGQDHRMRRFGLPGNVCCAIIQLDRGFDADRLRRRIAESPIMDWLARARIWSARCRCCRRSGGRSTKPKDHFFRTHRSKWQRGSVVVAAQGGGRSANCTPNAGPGLAFDVVRHADGTSHLYLSWNHTLLDARGLDFLLSHLNADSDDERSAHHPGLYQPQTNGARDCRLVAKRQTGARFGEMAARIRQGTALQPGAGRTPLRPVPQPSPPHVLSPNRKRPALTRAASNSPPVSGAAIFIWRLRSGPCMPSRSSAATGTELI